HIAMRKENSARAKIARDRWFFTVMSHYRRNAGHQAGIAEPSFPSIPINPAHVWAKYAFFQIFIF
ncbi:MAG: hypothetical protein ACXW1B_07390, partial [Nitrososphaeraceae archaeon]